MKKITLLLAVALMAIATNASAQFVNGGSRSSMVADTDNYSRLELGYSPISIEKLDLTGVSVGWTKGINLTKSLPLFLEVGANVMYGFDKENMKEYDEDITTKTSLLSINVPVTVAWKFSFAESFSLIPHVGLNLRGNILGKSTTEYEYYDDWEEEYYTEEVDLFGSNEDVGKGKRVNVGATVGFAANFKKFTVGLGYTFDFNETWELVDKTNYLTVSVGLNF
jgi:opacity protein-like surface antigen